VNVAEQHLNNLAQAKRLRPNYITSARVIPNPKARLVDQVREVLRVKHYAIRTEEAYVHWI
jgi:hypothetical protein